MYTCLGGAKGVGKGEEKMDTIHLLSQCCFGGTECLEAHCVLGFWNLVMKIGGVVYHTVSFPNCSLLLYLKL